MYKRQIKALAHVTGGGFPENLPRVLPQGPGVDLDLDAIPVLPVFSWLAKAGGVAPQEMLRAFNCGVGMVCYVDAAKVADAEAALRAAGERPVRIGKVAKVTEGPRVRYTGALKL